MKSRRQQLYHHPSNSRSAKQKTTEKKGSPSSIIKLSYQKILLSLILVALALFYLTHHIFKNVNDHSVVQGGGAFPTSTSTRTNIDNASKDKKAANAVNNGITNAISGTTVLSLHPRYVTIVLPSVVNTQGRSNRLQSIEQSWGSAAKAIYVYHPGNEYSPTSILQSSSSYPQTLLVPSEVASEDQGVPRLKYVIEQIYRTYNPDFAFFVNDHTYVIPQAACEYLSGRDPSQHLYAGHALKPNGQDFAFNSGASGYFLSRKTMRFLTENWSDCEGKTAHNRKWLEGNPGLLTAKCLKASIGIDPLDSRDEVKRHRFHAFGLVRTVKGEVDEWYKRKHENLSEILGEDTLFNHMLQKGEGCCSDRSISFHYVEFKETLALTKVLNKLREQPTINDEKLKEFIIHEWPKEKKDVGGYAHNLPPSGKEEVWRDLLKVLKNIAPTASTGKCI